MTAILLCSAIRSPTLLRLPIDAANLACLLIPNPSLPSPNRILPPSSPPPRDPPRFSSMGCSQSHLEPDEEAHSGSRHSVPLWTNILRRKDRGYRKGALVSAAEIPESTEAGKGNHSSQQAGRIAAGHASPDRQTQAQDPEGKRRKSGLGPAIGKGRKSGKGDDGDEELPGSPSFRYYFEGPWEEKESTDKVSEQQYQGH